MRTLNILAFTLAAACGSPQHTATAPAPAAGLHKGLNIKLATLYVDDQEKCLRFYTDVLGFAKKDDVTNGGYRWLTVTAPGDSEGTQLLLAANDNPAAKAYQQAMLQQNQPAAMFFTDDIKADYERIKSHGAEFSMPPTDITVSMIAQLEDTCGNLIQLTQLAH
jgi:predicted enzyme related to lactoylglutathione lyase